MSIHEQKLYDCKIIQSDDLSFMIKMQSVQIKPRNQPEMAFKWSKMATHGSFMAKKCPKMTQRARFYFSSTI